MIEDLSAISRHVERMRRTPEAAARDYRQNQIRLARAGNYELISEDVFTESWPKPVVANFINTAAMDMAESLAPLPSLNCISGSMVSKSDKDRGAKRTKIGNWYWQSSKLKQHAVMGADWFFTYGFVPFVIEPDFDVMGPRIRFEDPYMSYPEITRYGECLRFTKVFRMQAERLASMFPEHYYQIVRDRWANDRSSTELEVVRFTDESRTVMYFNDQDRNGKMFSYGLASVEHGMSRTPVVIARRNSLDMELRGQYDDAIWVQLARAKMASLALEAGMKAVESPIAVPDDMVELPVGPDAIWRTNSPEKIRRIGLEVPSSAFAMDQRLNEEAMRSTRYPEARGGNINASVITGRGVDALMGSFDMLIKTAQDQFGEGLQQATEMAFEMDEKMFGDVQKEIVGISAGAPFKEKYKPREAIKGDYSCEVTYGLAAGLSPNNAVVMMLQLLGAGLVSKESVMSQLPFDVNVDEMNRSITVERGRDAVLSGVAALAQSIPAMAAQGADPRETVRQMSVFLDSVRKGKDIEEAAMAAFTPPEPTPEELAAQEAEAAALGGGTEGGLPTQGPLGDQGAEALPDIASMVASFRGGRADLGASVKRNVAL